MKLHNKMLPLKRKAEGELFYTSKKKKLSSIQSATSNLLHSHLLNECSSNKIDKRNAIFAVNKLLTNEFNSNPFIEDDSMKVERNPIEMADKVTLDERLAEHVCSPSFANGNFKEGKVIPLPPYWEKHESDELVKMVRVEKDSWEFDYVADKFLDTISNVEIISIERVQNLKLYSWYYMKKQSMKEKFFNNGDANEKMLFHATNMSYMDCIKKEGLDPRLAKMTGSIGVGVYFSKTSATTVSYTKDSDQVKKMLLCRVLVGKSIKGKAGILRPPYLFGTKEMADSTHGDIGNDRMWSIFDLHQSYPEYVISFSFKQTKGDEDLH